MHLSLAAETTQQALEGELLLCALESRMTEGMLSFGLCMRADTDAAGITENYASSVDGAAQGSGSVYQNAEGSFTLSFQYTSGAVLTGRLEADVLAYSRMEDGQTVYSFYLSPVSYTHLQTPHLCRADEHFF